MNNCTYYVVNVYYTYFHYALVVTNYKELQKKKEYDKKRNFWAQMNDIKKVVCILYNGQNSKLNFYTEKKKYVPLQASS